MHSPGAGTSERLFTFRAKQPVTERLQGIKRPLVTGITNGRGKMTQHRHYMAEIGDCQMDYCPVCGSIDIIAGRCQHCGSPAEQEENHEEC